MKRESPTHDHLLFPLGGHKVMYDRLQIVIQHPPGCPNRGSGLDHRKTFHRWPSAISKLRDCGETPTEGEVDQIEAKGRMVDAAIR